MKYSGQILAAHRLLTRAFAAFALCALMAAGCGAMVGCAGFAPGPGAGGNGGAGGNTGDATSLNVNDTPDTSAEALRAQLNIAEYLRTDFVHGQKTAQNQKYIMLHDTQMDEDAQAIAKWWEENGNLVAAHFIVNKDGTIVQCGQLDDILHHAGFGDTGHNAEFGVEDESRDDRKGTEPIGDWASDYGMNSYSVGIELVHVGGEGDYPEAQLEALDKLIAYIDAYYGFESAIIDHADWRTGNPDTSEEFAGYLANYQDHRTHQ